MRIDLNTFLLTFLGSHLSSPGSVKCLGFLLEVSITMLEQLLFLYPSFSAPGWKKKRSTAHRPLMFLRKGIQMLKIQMYSVILDNRLDCVWVCARGGKFFFFRFFRCISKYSSKVMWLENALKGSMVVHKCVHVGYNVSHNATHWQELPFSVIQPKNCDTAWSYD